MHRAVHAAWALTTPPAEEPVSLDEAKEHLRVDDTASDTLIDSLLIAARAWVEEYTGRALVTQSWTYVTDRFPYGTDEIRLPRPPLRSVTSLTYVDEAGQSQTWASSNYRVDTVSEPGRLTRAYSVVWPIAQDIASAVTMVFEAGYGDAEAVPQPIKQAILLLVGHWFANREPVVVGTISKALEFTLEALLSPYRVMGWDG